MHISIYIYAYIYIYAHACLKHESAAGLALRRGLALRGSLGRLGGGVRKASRNRTDAIYYIIVAIVIIVKLFIIR